MIKILTRIQNPFNKNSDYDQKDFFIYDKKISKNKSFETQLTYFGMDTLFEFDCELMFSGCDHAGPFLSLTLFGLFFSIQIYDRRHWDHDTNTWEEN